MFIVANYITKLRGLKREPEWFVARFFGLQIISQNYVVWNQNKSALYGGCSKLQIISQNYVVWNSNPWGITFDSIKLQIISQNYVVWNFCNTAGRRKLRMLQIISQNYVVWNSLALVISAWTVVKLQIISQNYVVWNIRAHRASLCCRLQLQIISQNYVVWNLSPKASQESSPRRCKLYHKTTWFETEKWHEDPKISLFVANYITKLRGLKQLSTQILAKLILKLQIISQNYVVWN